MYRRACDVCKNVKEWVRVYIAESNISMADV